MTDDRELQIVDLGLIDYDEAHRFQRAAAGLRVRGELAQDLLILCEHPRIVTTGRSTKAENLLASAAELTRQTFSCATLNVAATPPFTSQVS